MGYNNRKQYNKLILSKLKYLIDKYPDLRMNQILQSSGLVILDNIDSEGKLQSTDGYYEESVDTFIRMEKMFGESEL